MKKIILTGGLIVSGAVLLLTGCGASKGFVQEEITKNRTEINAEHAKNLDDKTSKLNNDLIQQIMEIKKDYAMVKQVESKLYDFEQKIMKVIETKVAEINQVIQALQEKMDTFKVANQEDVVRLSQELKIAANILWKKLREEKEGLERAMSELEKLEFSKAVQPPETITPPPPETPPEKQ